MTRVCMRLLLACVVALVASPALAQDDAEGCKDSPLITRMPGSSIHGCEAKEFEQVELAVGKSKDGSPVMKTVEGDYPYLPCAGREGRSTELFLRFSRGDPASMTDPTLSAVSGTAYYTPRYRNVPT